MPIMNAVIQGGGTTPTGTKNITSNGVYNVTDYASADVQVPTSGPDVYIPRSLETSGSVVTLGNNAVTESMISTKTATVVGSYAFAYSFYSVTGALIPSVSMPDVDEVQSYAFWHAFEQAGSVQQVSTPTFSAPNLRVVSIYAFNYAFAGAAPFESFDFPSVTSVAGYSFSYAFGSNTQSVKFNGITSISLAISAFSNACYRGFALTELKFENLATISGSNSVFSSCIGWNNSDTGSGLSLSVSFPKLRTIENSQSAFGSFATNNKHIQSFSFPLLQTITGSSNCFYASVKDAYYGADDSAPSVSFSSLKTIDSSSSCFQQLFSYSGSGTALTLTGVDFSNLEVVTGSANCFYQAFYKTTGYANGEMNLFPKLRWIQTDGNYDYGVFRQAFSNSVGITRAIFPELKVVSGGNGNSNYTHFNNTFNGVSGLTTIEFPKLKYLKSGLTNISGSVTNIIFGENLYGLGVNALVNVFNNQTGIDFTIPVEMLSTSDSVVTYLGASSSVVRFPVLGYVSNTGALGWMLYNCSDVTLHFPAAVRSGVEALSGYPAFSGTNITVLFDLVYQVNDGTTTFTRFHDGYNTTSMGYQKDYIVRYGVNLYRMANEGASWSNVEKQIYTFWQAEGSSTRYVTYNSEPTAGEQIYTTGGAASGTVSSYVKNRVYVPIAAEPSVGDTLYSDEACTVAAGTVASIV